ncbi:hypothetical protein EMCRGX_G015402 [Ephydatia muelleri]
MWSFYIEFEADNHKMIMIHTSYSGSTYNTQEDISDASVLLNKFNTGDGQGAEQHCQSQCNHHWRDMLNQLLLQLIWDPNNTALSSYTSSSNPLVFVEEVLVTGHEIGHSWGSYHDPATTPSCSNVFIMNQYAQDGSQPTHKMFSNCSRTSIGAVLSAKAQNCFTVRGTGVCGDYVVTSGEQCDAGLLGDTCWTDACQLRSTAMCRSLPVFLHWIPTFNIHLCNKNGGGHQVGPTYCDGKEGTVYTFAVVYDSKLSDVKEMETEMAWIHELDSGKAIDEPSMRQRKRKLEAIKGNAVKALSFTESYGLTADTLTMHTASGNHTRAAVKGCEDYETISNTFVIGRTFKSFATPYLLKCQFILTLYTRTLRFGRMSGKPLLLPEIYSGESQCWSDWIEHFESVAALNKWATEDEKLKWLKVRLAGKARTAFQKLPRNVREEYGECLKALKQRFEPDSKKELYVAELHTRTRRIDEDWATFGDALKVLADKAYSDLEEKARERLALTQYLAHIENPQIAFGVRQKRPETVDAAVTATIELESYLGSTSGAQKGT